MMCGGCRNRITFDRSPGLHHPIRSRRTILVAAQLAPHRHAQFSSISYLRTRSRWTQALEDKLIKMCQDNEPCPNMNEWPEKNSITQGKGLC